MPRLIIFDDQVRGVDLPTSPVIIGRSKKSDIPIRDDVLSRKHCAILPTGDGFRLVDLKSSYGTYLNGRRIEKVELAYDDVIEVGRTVMVFMDDDVWRRGEGLARLRNPLKAQELIQRLRMQSGETPRIPVKRVHRRAPPSRRKRDLLQSLPVLEPITGGGGERPGEHGELLDLIVDYAVYKTVGLLVRDRPRLRRWLAETVESALIEVASGNWADLRPRLREALKAKLTLASREAGGASGADAGPDAVEAVDETPTPPQAAVSSERAADPPPGGDRSSNAAETGDCEPGDDGASTPERS